MKPSAYQTTAGSAITDPVLQKALTNLQIRFGRGTAEGYRRLPEGPDLRLKAHDIRMRAIENLDTLLTALVDKIRANGGQVHFAADGAEAVKHCPAVASPCSPKRSGSTRRWRLPVSKP